LEYKLMGLPPEPELEQKDLLERLKKIHIWRSLPFWELKDECAGLKVSVGGLAGDDEEKCRTLVERLTKSVCAAAFEAKGIPVRRLRSLKGATEVAKQLERFGSMDEEALRVECRKLGITATAQVTREGLLERMRSVLLWREMPYEEIRLECKKRKVEIVTTLPKKSSDEERCGELRDRLLAALCAEAFQAKGVPAQRLGSLDSGQSLGRAVRSH